MAFNSSSPVVHDGKIFDLVGVSLITSPFFSENKVGARVVLVLEPYRIGADGKIERPMKAVEIEDEEGAPMEVTTVDTQYTKRLSFSDAYAQAETDPALAQAMMSIGAALQGFINAKGV